jgi:two-component system response regulator WspF
MRIGIVNDMLLAQEALRRVVQSSLDHEVAWTANDGSEAAALARADRPDLILMDLFMSGTDGVEATRRIMGESPCAILIVTATVTGHLSKVYQAMGYGALDAIDTPTLGARGEIAGASLLLHKIELIGKLLGKSTERVRAESMTPAFGSRPGSTFRADGPLEPLIVVGASTGGPHALAEILARLPRDLAAGIIIVQHVDAAFAPGLSEWLSAESRRQVTLIRDGHRPGSREVLLSGTDDHLVMRDDQKLTYSVEPKSLSFRPSVDVFFTSLVRNWPRPGVAVLLTGMGRDGAAGLLELRAAGWRTIAQDEASCVVWGMPKAAAQIGAAEEILPLSQIAGAIASLVPKDSHS